MRWVTRPGCHVDRAACAWLIVHHIDTDATFAFTDDDIPDDATAFDMVGVALSHHGGDCSFETILRTYELDDPVLWDLARIVHEADLGDDRFDVPEAPGLDAVIRGLALVFEDDHELVERALPLFDGLRAHLARRD